jgi:thiol:disulfide interchange protein DsbD
MNRAIPLVLCLLTVFFLAACANGIHSKTGGGPSPASAAPAEISSSAQVVKVTSSPVTIPQNGAADAVVTLSISPGFHVNANPATFPYLIATEVKASTVEGITVGAPSYPAAEKKKFQFAEEPLAVYEGQAGVKLNLRTEKNAAAGSRSLPITVRIQACDNEQCFPPASVSATIAVEVK